MRKLLTLLISFLPFGLKAKSVSGLASYYADSYVGRRMADGTKYDHQLPIVATYCFPLGTKVRVEYTSRGGQQRSVIATVRDRGPAKWLTAEKPDRLFDLSLSVFRKLETPRAGVIAVTVSEIK